MNIYTIGYTKKSAEEFFEKLKNNNVKVLIDVRLNNTSHLAGFAKKEHLIYFLDQICNIDFYHYDFLAPTKEILNNYKKKNISWQEYEKLFNVLLEERNAIKDINKNILSNSCLLCAEPTANKCHRRLVAEYINKQIKDVDIIHV